MPAEIEAFAAAILMEASALISVELSPAEARRQATEQLDVDLFETGLVVGDEILDSLTFTELLATIEERLGASLLSVEDFNEVRTLAAFVVMLRDLSDPTLLKEFESSIPAGALSSPGEPVAPVSGSLAKSGREVSRPAAGEGLGG